MLKIVGAVWARLGGSTISPLGASVSLSNASSYTYTQCGLFGGRGCTVRCSAGSGGGAACTSTLNVRHSVAADLRGADRIGPPMQSRLRVVRLRAVARGAFSGGGFALQSRTSPRAGKGGHVGRADDAGLTVRGACRRVVRPSSDNQ